MVQAVRTHWVESGRGAPLVLVHGVGLDLTMWDQLEPALARNHRVVRYDLPGHGATPTWPVELTLEHLAQQLQGLLGELRLRHVTLVGFSLGVAVVLQAALREPGPLARLVLLSGVHGRSAAQRAAVAERLRAGEAEGPASIAQAALRRWFTPAFTATQPRVVACIRQRLVRNEAAGFLPAYRLFASEAVDFAGRLAPLQLPALVMTGAEDPGATPDMARRLAREIAHTRLAIVPGMRHLLPIEGAAAVAAGIEDFVRDTVVGAAGA